MQAEIQYNFFETREETESRHYKDKYLDLEKRMSKCEDSSERVRKSQFAKIGGHEKRIRELEDQLQILTRCLCNG